MGNSTLVSYTKLSPNNSGKRTHAIDRITPHCVGGLQELGANGPTKAAKATIQDYINKQAHKREMGN